MNGIKFCPLFYKYFQKGLVSLWNQCKFKKHGASPPSERAPFPTVQQHCRVTLHSSGAALSPFSVKGRQLLMAATPNTPIDTARLMVQHLLIMADRIL